MIINKTTKQFQTRCDKQVENWTNDTNVYVVDDNSPLAIKIIKLYPYFNFMLENGELIDIIETERPIIKKEPTEIEKLQQQLLATQAQLVELIEKQMPKMEGGDN